MRRQIAIDFGTTNTVIAEWFEGLDEPRSVRLNGLSAPPRVGQPPLVPSLVYVQDGQTGMVLAGWSVHASGYDVQNDRRFFASFKRGVAARHRPLPREIDGVQWDDARAGHSFLAAVLDAVTQADQPVEELVLTVPIQSFERYLEWLTRAVDFLAARRLRIVDEPTAAALGYNVRAPGSLVLVFDFGGGTLDISLVRTPAATRQGPGVLYDVDGDRVSRRTHAGGDETAVVVAKAGQVLGGEDIDHWLIDDILARNGILREDAGGVYPQLKQAVEELKIRLSEQHQAELGVFDPDNLKTYRAAYTRGELEELLDKHGFYDKIQATIDQVLRAARQHGIYKEDIEHVFMVGGTSLMPSVGRMLRTNFGRERVHTDRPFTAVAHGALGLATGTGLDDFLYHGYGLRHLSAMTGHHEYHEIIAPGTRYPMHKPIELILCASQNDQEAIEMVIGEIEDAGSGLTEVYFGEHQIVVAEGVSLKRVAPLNADGDARTIAKLNPTGAAGKDRIKVEFTVDDNRGLRVTVTDILVDKVLLDNVKVVELR
ncbi:MAG: Hsp70 family protein [Anaerolineae bacterium]|nr:Hsp70 family protein [Anaerolineae bacterium]